MHAVAAEIRTARDTDEFPPTPGSHCRWCGYRDRCPVVSSAIDEPPASVDYDAEFVATLQAWLESRGALINVLVQLRRAELEDAVVVLLSLADVEAMRDAFENWLEVVSCERAAALFVAEIPAPLVVAVLYAFYGVKMVDDGPRV
jgi:hypothetical protein